ncbi:hypothetical protein Salat_0655100 [Sesamum alatum]|uniref:Uncharacterized protein n=1 Tax=Sesamum alatum TaxID=300844 RepID=A0AAE1YRM8_9LAMI|nr:hypothetical protein Salat_0655100 [Sesamum alatum]
MRPKPNGPFPVDPGSTPKGAPRAMSRASMELDRHQPAKIKHVEHPSPKGNLHPKDLRNLSGGRISPQLPCWESQTDICNRLIYSHPQRSEYSSYQEIALPPNLGRDPTLAHQLQNYL